MDESIIITVIEMLANGTPLWAIEEALGIDDITTLIEENLLDIRSKIEYYKVGCKPDPRRLLPKT